MGSPAPLAARAAALAYVAVGAYATRVAMADRVPARFAGRTYPGPDAVKFVWLGTALSAPVYVLAAYARAGLRGDRRSLQILAATTIAGQLGEPITWRGASNRQRALVAANLALPVAITVSLRRKPRAESRL